MLKCSIGGLDLNSINFVVSGLIIGKSNVTKFEKTEQPGQPQTTTLRGVVKYLVRDTCDHFINVTVWGTDEFVRVYNSQFTIGHVVDVFGSKIAAVRHDDIYNPVTSSPLQLTINEGFGSIEFVVGDVSEKLRLLHTPLKSMELALNLADIVSEVPTTSDAGNLVDLVVLVAKIRPSKQIGSKLVRDVVVVDPTVPGVYMTIWNEAWIHKSDSWNEMSTVLHLVNVGFKYSKFHKSTVLVTLSRTVIIVDPEGDRSNCLKEYGQNSASNLFELDYAEPELSTIKTVMTVRQISNRLNDSSGDSVFYSLTYAVITQMDIDGWTPFYSRRCIHCNCRINLQENCCNKDDCSLFFAENPLDEHFINYFNIPVHLSDHTGTLDQCRLVGDAADRILGCSLGNFLQLTDSDRSSIKWKFLMERCRVLLSVKRRTALRWNTQITILDCQVANPTEVMEKIKVY